MEKEKIIIQTTPYFSKEKWEKTITDSNLSGFEFQYFSNYNEIKNNNPKQAFVIEPISYLNNCNPQNIKLLYSAISDSDLNNVSGEYNNLEFYSSKGLMNKVIAEHCIMVTLSLFRQLNTAILLQKNKKWDQRIFLSQRYSQLSQHKVGILGYGQVGAEVAKVFKPLAQEINVCNRSEKKDATIDNYFSLQQLHEFLKYNDVVIVCIPLRKETRNLIGNKELELIGSNGYLVNVSRGDIIVEEDLIYALQNKIIKGAALDVFKEEPLHKKSRLWKQDNVIITPHIAGNVNNFVSEIQRDFIIKLKNLSL